MFSHALERVRLASPERFTACTPLAPGCTLQRVTLQGSLCSGHTDGSCGASQPATEQRLCFAGARRGSSMATRGYTDAPQVNDRRTLAPSSDGPSCSGSEQSGDAKDALRERKLTAAYRHDVFNLFALGLINSMNFWYLWSGEGAPPPPALSPVVRPEAQAHARTRGAALAGFQVFWATTMLYFLADFAWILRDPLCVKSPRNILLHHCLSAVFALWPFWYPYVAPKMSYVMTVEVRRRTARSLAGQPWGVAARPDFGILPQCRLLTCTSCAAQSSHPLVCHLCLRHCQFRSWRPSDAGSLHALQDSCAEATPNERRSTRGYSPRAASCPARR